MKKLLTVSVIIPVFNQEKYIERCLRSILTQDFSSDEYEIIVINDGSTDKTPEALKNFREDITILNNETNKGLPYSINRGIKESKSKYLIRLDSDDYVNKDFLKIMTLFLETNNDIDAAACDYFLVNDKEDIISRKDCLKSPIACGIIFRKDHLVNIGLYDESFLINEEKDLRIRFLKKYKIHRIELPLYRYRMHEQNMTKNVERVKFHDKKLYKKHEK